MHAEISRGEQEKFVGQRVLIVDDEALIRWSMAETLSHAGYAVVEAASGKDALERLSNGPAPAVILLDFRLPDSDDLRLLATIRRLVPQSQVIMMTAFGPPAVQAEALELGAFRVISKPFELEALVPLVDEARASR
jgi:two-component system response regulator AtoC